MQSDPGPLDHIVDEKSNDSVLIAICVAAGQPEASPSWYSMEGIRL